MSKITKKKLQQSIDLLNKENSSQHNYLMRIKRALKSIDIDILSDEFDEPKPQLKQLDQSVFEGLDEKWRFAAVDSNGEASVFDGEPELRPRVFGMSDELDGAKDFLVLSEGYDTSNWQNSLIERDIAKELLEVDLSGELTGSELCEAMLARGDEYVVCLVSNVADSHAIKHREHTTLIEQWVGRDGFYNYRSQNWGHAVPVNPATNEPLTQAEVGL